MSDFGDSTDDFQARFDKSRREMDVQIEAARKRAAAGQRVAAFAARAQAVTGCAMVLIGAGVIGFACWCLYHILKAKGLVP